MNGERNLEQSRLKNCRAEYSTITEGWKFFAALRFVVAAFKVTLQSALVALYNQTTKSGGADKAGAVIALAGIYTIIAVLFIEWRTVMFLVETMRRGVELEFSFGSTNGFFSRVSAPKLFRPHGVQKITTHASGLALLYLSILMIWIYLSFINLFK